MIEQTVNYIKADQVSTRKLEYLEESYGFGLRCHCTSPLPCPSIYSYFSFCADLNEVESFDARTLSKDDVLLIAHELGPLRKMVGRVLNVPDAVIDQIEANKSEVSDKCYSKCNLHVVIVG